MPKTKIPKIIACLLILSFSLPVFASTRNVTGVLGGKKKKYSVPLNDATYQTIFNLPDYTCSQFGYTDATLGACHNFLNYDRADQKEAFVPLVRWITKKIKKSDDRVRVAASIVQNMEYDYDKYYNNGENNGRGHGARYLYETLYENKGICGEKAEVIVYLLKQLGYGTAEITFLSPSFHEVAGVKCADAYDFRDTGYCFIDPITRHMITFAGSYKDYDPYLITPISDGKTFNAKKDFTDSQKWWKVLLEGTGSRANYKLYKKLVKKYGM
ncbi:MAG TPA: hypothetical protein VK254_03890 [Candidatus Bathyarchaeia archaeon]|nr:hypothetical protein [Candidatus Bathyarchaeia archaeon]